MYSVSNVELNQFLLSIVGTNNNLDNRYRFALELLYKVGVRAGEAISFNYWLKINDQTYSLQPQKHNNLRVFDITELPNNFSTYFDSGADFYSGFTYNQLEYGVSKLFSSNRFMVGTKFLTTHIFRHNYAKQCKFNNMTNLQIQIKMGERWLSSAENYIDSNIFSFYKII